MMPQEPDQHKQNLVDSLLQSLYETDKEQSRSLVSSGMQRLEELETRIADESEPHPLLYVPRWLTIALAIAAVVCIAIYIPMLDNSRSAMAAVSQSLNQALQDVGRHYVVRSQWRLQNQSSETHEVDLFVKGGDQFAVKVPGPLRPIRPIWIGSNQEYSWVVPPIGPVLEGNRRSLFDWFDRRKDVATPYLHVTTALEMMGDIYDLKTLPGEEVEAEGNMIWCHRVNGVLKGESSNEKPNQIDLWANAESGVAIKLVATWDLAKGESGRESLTILLQEELELKDDFFTPESHGGLERNRIDFSSEN